MDVFTEAFRQLEGYAQQHEGVLVSYSGGKDSLVVLDLAVRVFRRVVCFHYYVMPGLEVVERQLRLARDRWGVDVLLYPDPTVADDLKAGIYCDESDALAAAPDLTIDDIKAMARADSGIPLIVTGSKRADGLGRGLANQRALEERRRIGRDDEILPLVKWNKWEVLAYLKSRDIPLPESDGRNSASIDLSNDCLLWLHDKHPADFETLCKLFRYAPAVVRRRLWHGVH